MQEYDYWGTFLKLNELEQQSKLQTVKEIENLKKKLKEYFRLHTLDIHKFIIFINNITLS